MKFPIFSCGESIVTEHRHIWNILRIGCVEYRNGKSDRYNDLPRSYSVTIQWLFLVLLKRFFSKTFPVGKLPFLLYAVTYRTVTYL